MSAPTSSIVRTGTASPVGSDRTWTIPRTRSPTNSTSRLASRTTAYATAAATPTSNIVKATSARTSAGAASGALGSRTNATRICAARAPRAISASVPKRARPSPVTASPDETAATRLSASRSAMPRLASSSTSPSREMTTNSAPVFRAASCMTSSHSLVGSLDMRAPSVVARSSARAAAWSSLAVARFATPKEPMDIATASPTRITIAGARGRSGQARPLRGDVSAVRTLAVAKGDGGDDGNGGADPCKLSTAPSYASRRADAPCVVCNWTYARGASRIRKCDPTSGGWPLA